MSEPVIQLFSTQSTLADKIRSRFEQDGFVVSPANYLSPSPAFTYLCLCTPVFFHNTYMATAKLWKNYLSVHHPNTKLLTIGFQAASHSNHIDLLQWPANLKEYLAKAATVSESWQPVKEEGLDVEQRLHRFFEGHGDESLTDVLHKILRVLIMARDEVKHHQVAYEEVYRELIKNSHIREKWDLLINRWVNYLPYFRGLPFYNTFEEMDNTLKAIAPFFISNCQDENLFHNLECVEALKTIKEELELIARQYVN